MFCMEQHVRRRFERIYVLCIHLLRLSFNPLPHRCMCREQQAVVSMPRTRRVLSPHPLQHIPMTLACSCVTSELSPRTRGVSASCITSPQPASFFMTITAACTCRIQGERQETATQAYYNDLDRKSLPATPQPTWVARGAIPLGGIPSIVARVILV
jgi:hypothetical protein